MKKQIRNVLSFIAGFPAPEFNHSTTHACCDHRLQELREQLLSELKTRSTVADGLKQHAASSTAGEEDMHKMYEARKFRDGIAKSIEILDSLT